MLDRVWRQHGGSVKAKTFRFLDRALVEQVADDITGEITTYLRMMSQPFFLRHKVCGSSAVGEGSCHDRRRVAGKSALGLDPAATHLLHRCVMLLAVAFPPFAFAIRLEWTSLRMLSPWPTSSHRSWHRFCLQEI